MAGRTRNALASAIGWTIVALIAIWAFGMVIGWIRFVLRSVAWLIVIGVLLFVYFAIKGPPDDA